MQHHFKTFATDFQLILDRASEWRARIEMIKNARRFLYVSTYYIEYDNYAIEFFSELTKAVGRGVRVTVVIDAFGQKLSSNLMAKTGRRLLRKAFDAFHKNGGEIICYRPPKILQKLLGTGYHIKYQVSEEGRILFASSNISQMSYNRWFEFAVMLNGPVSVIMLEDLFQILENPNREDLDFLKRQIQNQAVAKEQNYAFEFFTYVPAIDPSPFSPIRQYWTNPITTGLIKSINQAQKKIELTSFYFKPHPKLFDAIESAAKRGVRVEIHHSHRGALAGVTRLPWLAASARYPRLLRQSVKIYEHLQGQHTKFVLIDDRIAWLGSYNFEHSADDRLAEAMLVTEDAMIVKEIRTFFDELKNDE
ncbi:MAG: phosphatidylserine/phosphatidylglycerophosphate/cardiolipin synthase family protein, partial [bacterium]